MEDKNIDELILDICSLVELYSENDLFVFDVEINTSDKTNSEMCNIKLSRNDKDILMSVIKSKMCGTRIISVRRKEDGNQRFSR